MKFLKLGFYDNLIKYEVWAYFVMVMILVMYEMLFWLY